MRSLGDDPATYRVHAAYRLYTAAGVDACAMGNHDLDLGARLLAHALSTDAHFPLLTANLAGCSWLAGLYFPAALFVVKGVRVAVAGLTTPAQIAPQPDSTLHFVHPVEVMHNLLPALTGISDVVIVLSHLGYSLRSSSASVLAAGDVELAESLPPGRVHLIIGGHTHHALNEQGLSPHNIVNGIPIVQAGMLGDFVGEVDITVGRGCAAVTHAQLIPTLHLPVDEAFEGAHVQPLLRAVQPIFDQELGIVADDPDLSTDAMCNDFAAGESAPVQLCCRRPGRALPSGRPRGRFRRHRRLVHRGGAAQGPADIRRLVRRHAFCRYAAHLHGDGRRSAAPAARQRLSRRSA